MVRTAEAAELQRKRTLTERLNEFLEMVGQHGRSSGFRLGQFTQDQLQEFEQAGMRAREQRRFQGSVPRRVVREDIRADALEAALDLSEKLESGHVDLQRFIEEGRRAPRR
ncbi:MAG: hypothetical protein ABII71_01160 [Candidatus Micrarchaeota archaeon]